MKYIRALQATAIFTILLAVIYCVHMRYFKVDVVFYASIADGTLAAILTAACLIAFKRFAVFSTFEKWQLLFIWLLMGYGFAISIPTVIDRSLSFYILEKIQQRGGGIQQSRFADVFTQEYMKEHRLVDVRLTEQLASGTIVIENGCVKITPKGQNLAAMSRFFRQNLLPKHRLLMGEYSDDLTNPFRKSEKTPNYTCG
jgi:hypothetical protein